jgi:hypothetical protein
MLNLVINPRGYFILSKINAKGQRPIRIIFPPHAKYLALAALERTVLYLKYVNRNPTTSALIQMMTGHQIPERRPTHMREGNTRKVPRGTRRKKRAFDQVIDKSEHQS